MPLLLAAKRALVLAVSALLPSCGVLGEPNAGAAGIDDVNGLCPDMPPAGAKLNPPLGAGAAGVARGPEIIIII